MVYLWEAGQPQRGLIARGTVIEPLMPHLAMPPWQHQFCQQPHQVEARSIIRVDQIEMLRKIPELAEASFFSAEKNPTGTIFHVRPKPTSTMSMQTLETALRQLQ
jgi:hypothetical protein